MTVIIQTYYISVLPRADTQDTTSYRILAV